jgi:hypothetical protein
LLQENQLRDTKITKKESFDKCFEALLPNVVYIPLGGSGGGNAAGR